MVKSRFEKCICYKAAAEVSHYRGNNGIFTTAEYQHDCNEKLKTQSFSGVGSQHQNAQSERAIQNIMYMACTLIVHDSLYWSDRGSDDIYLWSFSDIIHFVSTTDRLANNRALIPCNC